MNFDELKLPYKKKPKYISKKFYDKYFCKLVLKIEESKIKETKISAGFTSWNRYNTFTNRSELLGRLIKEVKKVIVNDDHRFRAEGKYLSIFTNDVNDLNEVMSILSLNFYELYTPINTNHSEVLDRHRAVVVRNSLYDKKYKFKVYMKPDYALRETRYKDVQLYLENIEDHGLNHTMNIFFNTDFSTRRAGWTAAIYLNNPSDLMMFQLRFNNDIQKIEEAVLISSL